MANAPVEQSEATRQIKNDFPSGIHPRSNNLTRDMSEREIKSDISAILGTYFCPERGEVELSSD